MVIIAFILFLAWWLYINVFLRNPNHNSDNNQAFGALYGVIALVGGLNGLFAARKWGGAKSLVGRAILFFSIGLLAQEFGQIAYSFYTYVLKINIPYPSVGDVGYFGSVLCYIYAAWQLAKASGIKFSLKDRSKKVVAVLLPLILLSVSYRIFLLHYQFDFSSISRTVGVLLDFGYPFGQAIYISIALMTYLLSKKLLGGVMKNKVLIVLFALLIQYSADFSFLLAAKNQTAFPAGGNDLMYLIAYTVMALALNSFIGGLPVVQKVPQVAGQTIKDA
jgi:hypothetical protein